MTTQMMTHYADVLADRTGPCISLFMPTGRGFTEKQQNPIRYKNLLREAEKSLATELSVDEKEALLAPLYDLITTDRFWNHTLDGLAVLRAPDFFKVYKLQQPVKEQAIVADSFHIKPLLRITQSSDRFEVLAVTRDHVKMYQGSRDVLDEIELDANIPRTLVDALGEQVTEPHDLARTVSIGGPSGGGASVRYGIGSKSDEVDKDAERFFRVIDRAVYEHHSKRSHLPLVLAALPEHHALFREVSHNAMLMPEGIAGNPDAFSTDQLREKAWEIVKPALDARERLMLDDFGAALPRQLASDNYADVAMAALAGRVRTLLVDAERIVPGRVDRATGEVTRGNLSDPHTDDIIDDLAELTLRTGGDVMVLPTERMSGVTGVAAIYRF